MSRAPVRAWSLLLVLVAGSALAQAPGAEDASCLNGNWQRSICGSPDLKARVSFSGGASGSGRFEDTDCTRQCTRSFNFRYQVLSPGSMRIDYTDGEICGEQKIPKGGVQAFGCPDGELQFGNRYQR